MDKSEQPSAAFASDNTAPAHPDAVSAIVEANNGNAYSYGNDGWTTRAAQMLKETFEAPQSEVLFTYTGTGANVAALSGSVNPHEAILTSDVAHALVDEAGGPTRVSGAIMLPLASDGGILRPESLDRAIRMRGDAHQSQPRLVTITQSTELGRVWPVDELNRFISHAHQLDLLVHVDGARLANAIVSLGATPAQTIGDADLVTVGGTKSGMLFGEAVLIRTPTLQKSIAYAQKQIGQLASKNRFIAAQFIACLSNETWLSSAAHANQMAKRLAVGLESLGFSIAHRVDANEVFVVLDTSLVAALLARFAAHVADPDRAVVRFVCSWSTTDSEVDSLIDLLRKLAHTDH